MVNHLQEHLSSEITSFFHVKFLYLYSPEYCPHWEKRFAHLYSYKRISATKLTYDVSAQWFFGECTYADCPPQEIRLHLKKGFVSRVSCRGTSSNLQFACAQSHFRCGGLFSSMSGERASLQVQLRRSGPLLSKIQHTGAPWHEECPSTDIMGKIQSKHNHQCEMLSRKC